MNEVLIVDDSMMNRMVLGDILKTDYNVISAGSGKEMFHILEESSPKLILLDVIMPELDGFEIIAKLKTSDEYNKIPVIFITGLDDAASEEKGFALGAIDYITKPFKPNVVRARVKSYIQLYDFIRKTEMLGQNDGLTGLYNKKMTEQQIKKQLSGNPPIKCGALMIIDVDNFKGINDTFGHLYGDAVITQLGSSLRSIFQKSDILGRVGGDEFFVFMRNYNEVDIVEQRAQQVCDEFRKTYEQGGATVKISASVGIATTDNSLVFEDIYKFADVALYSTKSKGKNGFTFYNGEEEITYKSDRTEIESSKAPMNDPVASIVDFNNSLKEYMFNLVESSKVAEYTIQSVLQMVCTRFTLDKAQVVKLNYEENSVKCIYGWISSDTSAKPIIAELTFSSITLLHSAFNENNLLFSPAHKHSQVFSPDQDDNRSMAVFALRNKKALLGYIIFEKEIEEDEVFAKIAKNIVDTCQQLSTVIINQFLLDNLNNEKHKLLSIINSSSDLIYVTKPEAKKPLFTNLAAENEMPEFHGRDCFKPNSSCDDCILKAAINNNGVYENGTYSCKEIDWTDGAKAYVIRKSK